MNEEDCAVTSDEAQSISRRLGAMESNMADMKAQVGDMQARMEVLSSGDAIKTAVAEVLDARHTATDARQMQMVKSFAWRLVVGVTTSGAVIGFMLERVIR